VTFASGDWTPFGTNAALWKAVDPPIALRPNSGTSVYAVVVLTAPAVFAASGDFTARFVIRQE
jgi:hypothetical protein